MKQFTIKVNLRVTAADINLILMEEAQVIPMA